MTPSEPTSPELLLAHAGWMRGLALGLVHDPHEADDVAQDAALAALLHPPPPGAALRPWLATVVRNFAWRRRRAQTRRDEHEDRARKPESDDDGIAALERIDLQRKLLDAVRGLPEPVRTTVVQRYFEGRTSADIARSSDVPSATVRARLKRGLEALRARLDSEVGSRGAWMALIVPLVPRDFVPAAAGSGTISASVATQGVLTMTVAKIVLSSAAAALAAIAIWDFARSEPGREPLAVAPAEATPSEVPLEPPAFEAPQAAVRSAVPAAEGSELARADERGPAPTPTVGAPAQGALQARFVDGRGSPWPGVELSVMRISRQDAQQRVVGQALSDLDGQVRLEVVVPRLRSLDGQQAAYEFQLVARREGCVSHRTTLVVREGEIANLGEVVLLEGARVRGHVVDEHGSAIAGASVGALPAELLDGLSSEELESISRVGSEAFDALLTVSSRADGSFELGGLPLERTRLWAHSPGRRFGLTEAFEAEGVDARGDLELVLPDFRDGDLVRGRVVGPDGRGRRAELERDAHHGSGRTIDFVATDADGHFEFAVEHLDTTFDLTARDPLQEFGIANVRGVRAGDLDVLIAFGDNGALRIHVRDEGGEPVGEASFWFLVSGSSYTAPAELEAPGDYVVERPAASFRGEASAPGFRSRDFGPIDPAAHTGDLDVVLVRAPALRGTVLADGKPLAGVQVTAHRYDAGASMTVNARRCLISRFKNGEARSDAKGRFELAADLEGPFVIRASHPDWTDAEVGPLDSQSEHGELELSLSRGGAIEGFVRVPQGESASGRVVAVHRADGRARSVRTAEDGSYRFEGLMPGGWHVYTLEQDIRPQGGHYASYDGDEPIVWDCQVELGRTTRHELVIDGESPR